MQMAREEFLAMEQDNRLVSVEMLTLAVQELQVERVRRMEAEARLDAQKNKVRYADAVMKSRDSISVGELAGMLKQSGVETGRDRLFAWLREHGYLQSRESVHNLPTQRSLELGVLELREQAVNAKGTVKACRSSRVTRKGVDYFMDVFSREKATINAMEDAKRKAQNKRKAERRKIRKAEQKAAQEALQAAVQASSDEALQAAFYQAFPKALDKTSENQGA